MLQIEGMKLSLEEDESLLAERAAALLRVPVGDVREVRILRRAVDAREGVHLVYTLHVGVKHEAQVLRRCRNKKVSRAEERSYRLPEPVPTPAVPPVVVGAGPGGLFCALALARCGARPILLERGWNVERRQADVERFWSTGTLDTESNVQFGEGGAGAFSDGKLNTGTRDPRHRFILETLVSHGAPESILVDAKPHVGTDYLHRTLISLRRELEDLGCDVRFGHRLAGLEVREGHVTALEVAGPDGLYRLPARQVVLALGNSARDTFQMLHAAGVPMEPKPLAVGVRIEHRQRDIDLTQYKELAGHPRLGAASYIPGQGPLAGIAFQRELEERAFAAGGGGYTAPAQRVEDFLARRPSQGPGRVRPTYRPGVRWCDLWQVLPDVICQSLAEALPVLDKKLPGFADPDAVLTAVETRSSCPLRILRDEGGQSAVRGLFPCGEGAGYAGGILSAAADGMRTAEHVLNAIQETESEEALP